MALARAIVYALASFAMRPFYPPTMPDSPDSPHGAATNENDRAPHAVHSEAVIRNALAHKGVPPRGQTNALAEALSLTTKQVRRKLRDGIWTLPELLRLQASLDVSLSGVLSSEVSGAGGAEQDLFSNASLLINGEHIDCVVKVGPVMTSFAGDTLGCTKVKSKWLVSTQTGLDSAAPGELRYSVELLQVLESGSPVRIAVLDDDKRAAESLASWFTESGYPAKSFTTTAEVVGAGFDSFDVYVLDVMLSDGTCYGLIEQIRDADPDAVIILLTGKVRGNAPLEFELADVVAQQRVELAEKPTSPPLLLGRILKELARKPSVA